MALINKYYPEGTPLRHVLVFHSRCVMDYALKVCDRHPELQLNRQFVADAAMLHDIGIYRCDAPGIACHGSEPYILHGRLGASLLRAEGERMEHDGTVPTTVQASPGINPLEPYARVCERHTGAGLTHEEIERQHLPLPHQDFLPETLEEKLICYADKFFSKSNLSKEKSLEHVERSLAKFGEAGLMRFQEWEKIFS